MNGYGAPTELSIYGVPASLWATWSQFTKDKYMLQYNADVSGCFDHGDGRSTCYNEDTGDWEILAYTYTYGVDEVTGWEAVETGEKVNETIEEAQELYDTAKDAIPAVLETGAILGVLAAFLLLSKGR